jgi:hypothetical protein
MNLVDEVRVSHTPFPNHSMNARFHNCESCQMRDEFAWTRRAARQRSYRVSTLISPHKRLFNNKLSTLCDAQKWLDFPSGHPKIDVNVATHKARGRSPEVLPLSYTDRIRRPLSIQERKHESADP